MWFLISIDSFGEAKIIVQNFSQSSIAQTQVNIVMHKSMDKVLDRFMKANLCGENL
jgi:hemolysin-activating ACP:hemolysin acyltransferase